MKSLVVSPHREFGSRKAFLYSGILSSVLYVAMNVVAAMRFEGYSSVSQTVSELSAIGAPTRALWVILAFPYTLLATAFGWGVRLSAGGNRALRTTGNLLFVYGALGLGWPLAPMHLRGAPFTFTDTMHIVFAMVTVLVMVLAIGFGAASFGKGFRLYSIATLFVLAVFGALTSMDAPKIGENLPTPWVGLWERINIGVFLLWIVMLAFRVLQSVDESFIPRPNPG